MADNMDPNSQFNFPHMHHYTPQILSQLGWDWPLDSTHFKNAANLCFYGPMMNVTAIALEILVVRKETAVSFSGLLEFQSPPFACLMLSINFMFIC